MTLPPRPPPEPARAPAVMLAREEADVVIAAVRLRDCAVPVVREGVRVQLNTETNELMTVGAGGRVRSVGWSPNESFSSFSRSPTHAPASYPRTPCALHSSA